MQVVLAKEAILGNQKISHNVYYPTTEKSDMSQLHSTSTHSEVSASGMSKSHFIQSIALRVAGLKAVNVL